MQRLATIALATTACSSIAVSTAAANPRPLPFSYSNAMIADGDLEVEQYVDMTPLRVEREDADGTRAVVGMRYDMQTELEYGLTDRLEVGWYFAFRQGASATTPALRFQGVKQRIRMRLNDPGTWPVDVGLYLEAAEMHDELELEEKILLSRRFGAVEVVANLWIEQEYYFQDEQWAYIYNPTLGASAQLSPKVMVGAEYWSRGHFDPGPGDTTRHYAGPTVLVQEGEYFLSIGAYARLDALGERAVVGDAFGKLWVRALIGIGL